MTIVQKFFSPRLFKKKHILLLSILISVILAEYFIFFYSPKDRDYIRKLVLNSNISITDETIFEILQINKESSFKALDADDMTEKLKKQFMLSSIVVKKQLRNTLYIKLMAHNAVAAFIDKKGDMYYIDEDGQIFTSLAKTELIPPIIDGLGYIKNEITDQIEVAAEARPFLADLTYIKKYENKLFTLIDSITFLKNDQDENYATLVSFINLQNKALWPFRLTPDKLSNTIIVLTLLENIDSFTNEIIDFRTDEIVYQRGDA